MQTIIRNHWSIENKLHWCLDVCFNEDLNRKRTGNASQNFSLINKIALNLAKKEKSWKLGIKSKRLKAGWDNTYLKYFFAGFPQLLHDTNYHSGAIPTSIHQWWHSLA